MKNLCQIGLDCPFCHHTEDGEMACTFPDVDPREGEEYRLVCNWMRTSKGSGTGGRMIELRSCPFCGSKGISIQSRGSSEHRVICGNCGIRTPWGTLDDAVYGWNRRDPGA